MFHAIVDSSTVIKPSSSVGDLMSHTLSEEAGQCVEYRSSLPLRIDFQTLAGRPPAFNCRVPYELFMIPTSTKRC